MSKVQLTPSPKKSLSLILCIVFLAAVVLAVVGFVGKNAALTEKAALNVQLEDTLAQLEESKAEAEAKAAAKRQLKGHGGDSIVRKIFRLYERLPWEKLPKELREPKE